MNAAKLSRLLVPGHRQWALSSLTVTLVFILFMIPTYARAQASPITSSGLNTRVSPPSTQPSGQIQHNITGGTRPGGVSGTNLFHSFGDFSVPINNIANFLNAGSVDLQGNSLPPNLLTSHILGRVTGGNLSSIYGTIQTTGFGGANLFLINPAGFLFGPNATVNVGGMVTFASADYLRLADGVRFNAIPDAGADALLSASPVAAFGFLGSNPGAITVQGSQFTVTEGTGISLVGGDITVQAGTLDDGSFQPARLSAPGGQINLASVASVGEVSAADFMPASGMARGHIGLSEGALLDVSANAAGTVRIRSGQLTIDNAIVSSDTTDAAGAPIAIDVNVSGDLTIKSDRTPAFTARTFGTGNAGDIEIASGSLTVISVPDGSTSFSVIESYTFGSGNAGNVHLTTGEMNVSTDPFSIPTFFIDSGTGGEGKGGNVTIESAGAHFSNTGMNTGDSFSGGSGSAGNISIKSDSLTIEASTFAADSFSARGGDMLLEAREIIVSNNSFLDVLSLEGDSAVRIITDHLTVDDASSILNQTALGPGGGITIAAKTVEVTNSSLVLSQTFGDGDAGNIHVTATDHVTIADDPERGSNPSGFYTNSFGNAGLGTLGNAGSIEIITPKLTLTGGGRINSTTQSSGQGGDATIAAQEVILSGQRTLEVDSEFFGLGGTKATGIYTRTVGSEFCSGPCGDAGHVSITTGALTISDGAVINSGTTNTGRGGDVTVHATDTISLSGTMMDGTPGGIFSRAIGTAPDAGSGSNITLAAGQSVTISDGASVSASSTGPGNTGNIQIDAGNQFAMTNSSVTTEASQASGGAIKITTAPSGTVQLTDSTISASVLDGTGGGGSVNIDPQYVVLQGSQILAQAVQGPGGNITIAITNGGLFLPDTTSTVSASSQFGVDGTVTIQSPISQAGGKIQQLGKSPLQATSLLSQRCAALAGGDFSSFTIAGRDSLPAEPGGWLSSPLASLGAGTGQPFDGLTVPSRVEGEVRGLRRAQSSREGETPLLSLRQIAPPGFLTQAFAVDWSAGCTS